MVGQILDSGKVIATLEDDGTWKCNDKITLAQLELYFNPKDTTVSSLGFPFGMIALSRAAAALGLKAKQSRKIPPAEEGVLY